MRRKEKERNELGQKAFAIIYQKSCAKTFIKRYENVRKVWLGWELGGRVFSVQFSVFSIRVGGVGRPAPNRGSEGVSVHVFAA